MATTKKLAPAGLGGAVPGAPMRFNVGQLGTVRITEQAENAVMCPSCGTTYPYELVESWGKTIQSDGLGPVPRCGALVVDKAAAPPKDEQGRFLEEPVYQVCGRPLMMVQLAAGAPMVELAAIDPFSRGGGRG